MNIQWSPEAIEDLNSLRAFIAQDNLSAHKPSPSTPCRTSNSCFQTTRTWGVQVASPARVKPSSEHAIWCHIDYGEIPFRFCAPTTGRAGGLKVASAYRLPPSPPPG